jgi:N-methylhydantoinase B
MIWSKQGRLAGRGLRQIEGAPPLFGGAKGRTGQFVLHPGTSKETKLPGSFSELATEPGLVVRVETPSGAGYGNPLKRDSARVRADVISGKVSAEAARREYGVILREGCVDDGATNTERARRERRP